MFTVAVYCEGPAESGRGALDVAPGEALSDTDLGAAHVLVRRALESLASLESARARELQFVQPLFLRGAPARGGQLLPRANVRKLLAWPDPRRAPRLCVLIVDEDGQRQRLKDLRSYVEGLPPPLTAVAVAVREFESWLLADHRTLASLTRQAIHSGWDVESLEPREAKEELRTLTEQLRAEHSVWAAHRRIAEQLRLEELRSVCPSFQRFIDELRACLERTP